MQSTEKVSQQARGICLRVKKHNLDIDVGQVEKPFTPANNDHVTNVSRDSYLESRVSWL